MDKPTHIACTGFKAQLDEVRRMSDANLERSFNALVERVGPDASPENAGGTSRFMHRGDVRGDRAGLLTVGLVMDYVRFNRMFGTEGQITDPFE